MKVVICGSRTAPLWAVEAAIKAAKLPITTVICGMARGADLHGKLWARGNGIPVVEMPADWDSEGRRAGFLRNTRMASAADAVIAVWDGSSKGTAHMIRYSRQIGVPVYSYIWRPNRELQRWT